MYLANNDDDNNRDIFLSKSSHPKDRTPVPNQETNDADLAIFDRRDVEIDDETVAELAAEAEDAEDESDEKPRRPASRPAWKPLSKSEELTLIARVQSREPLTNWSSNLDLFCWVYSAKLIGITHYRLTKSSLLDSRG